MVKNCKIVQSLYKNAFFSNKPPKFRGISNKKAYFSSNYRQKLGYYREKTIFAL